MYAQHIKQGDDYNKITKCVAILFTDFEIENIKNIKQYITKWNFREETYSKMLADKLKEITDITQTLKQLENQTEKQKVKTIKQSIDYFDEIIKAEAPTKEVLAQVLDKIIIYQNKNLEFRLKVNLDKLI